MSDACEVASLREAHARLRDATPAEEYYRQHPCSVPGADRIVLLSETEDADMARTLTDLTMQQAVYQSALKSGAQIVQPSLIDFLR